MRLLHQTHLSAHQIAMLELDGLPGTRDGVRLRAKREGWASIERQGRGGGEMYAVASLPIEAQRDLFDRWSTQETGTRNVGRPKGSDFFTRNPQVAAAVEATLAARDVSAQQMLDLLATRFGALPSRRTLSRYMAQLEASKPALLASFKDPDAYKSKYSLALGRADGSITHAHQVWEIDTTMADVLTVEGRRAILGIIDVYSRRARYLVVPSESAQSVRRILLTTMLAWGVMPERLKTDRGSGFINETIKTALPHLGIELDPCLPGSPEKKPHVERLFGTFTRERASLLDGFAGHSVAQAQKLRGRAKKQTGRAVIVPTMTAEQLQAVIDAWIDGVYHQRVHSTTGATPMARWMASPRPAAAAPDEGKLKLALSAYVGIATVGKRGVQWKNGRYWSHRLVEFMGRQVQVRRDEDDLGALFIFDEDNRYIDTAVNAERAGLSEEAFAREAKAAQTKFMNAARADLRAKQRDFSFETARDLLLRRDAEAAGKLTTLPVATRERTTVMLDSTVDAPPPPPSQHLPEATRQLAKPVKRQMSIGERIIETDRVLAAHEAGETVDPAALKAARLFATSTEYRADKILRADFRPAAQPTGTTAQARENRL